MNRFFPVTVAALIFVWRVIRVTRTAMNIAKGVGAVVAIGAAAGLAGSCIASSRRSSMKRGMKKTARRMESIVDGMTHLFG